jgi:hypothetical protein
MKAFPKSASIELGTPQLGMDLRDYFAAKAMQGLASDPDWCYGLDEGAEIAYQWADAMMKARSE